MPAESVTKEFRFRYVLKRRTGGNNIGRAWKGRKCKLVMNVARIVGGSGDSGLIVRGLEINNGIY
jgi:hypothetical protein